MTILNKRIFDTDGLESKVFDWARRNVGGRFVPLEAGCHCGRRSRSAQILRSRTPRPSLKTEKTGRHSMSEVSPKRLDAQAIDLRGVPNQKGRGRHRPRRCLPSESMPMDSSSEVCRIANEGGGTESGGVSKQNRSSGSVLRGEPCRDRDWPRSGAGRGDAGLLPMRSPSRVYRDRVRRSRRTVGITE